MNNILTNNKLILVCGSGGVGKTTLSAALAVKAAHSGLKTAVITIDPARRLATAMGLKELSSEAKKIDLGKNVEGSLHAMMLDTKKTFDKLVETYAPNEEYKQKILNNRIYIKLSSIIAGSQEYMAMERLYEIVNENKYDLIIVDTPPTTHAIDFLEAPDKMINAISNSMIHLLIKPAQAVGKGVFKFFAKGTDFVLKVFDRIIGFAFLQEISEMLMSFQVLLDGFKNRAGEVREILEKKDSTFVIVCTTDKNSQEEARVFRGKLDELKLSLSAVLVNRIYPQFKIADPEAALGELEEEVGKTTAEKMNKVFNDYLKLAKRDKTILKKLKEDMGEGLEVSAVPLFEGDIHDIEGLSRLAELL
ncbi:ArsA family ATPase [bacterium]|nr:ArsA family ATPase [bacterium]